MINLKKTLALIIAVLMIAAAFASCAKKGEENEGTGNTVPQTAVRYLASGAEAAEKYRQAADEYEKETGIKIAVESAEENDYGQTLAEKMKTDGAPVIFLLSGQNDLALWEDYCADLSDSQLYESLIDEDFALTADGAVYGIPCGVECFGIIYNGAITGRYFALPDKSADFKSMDEINGFESLSAIVKDMQKNAGKLGIEGVFSSAPLKTEEDRALQTDIAKAAIYYELKNKNAKPTSGKTDGLEFQYAENFKSFFDLCTAYSVSGKKDLGNKTADNAISEFAHGKSAMTIGGSRTWEQIKNTAGNTVSQEDIKFLPLYMGIDGENNQGLCVKAENYFAVNSKASAEDQKAARDFLFWLYSNEKGKSFVSNELGFIAPFGSFASADTPDDPLARQSAEWLGRDGISSVKLDWAEFPSDEAENAFGAALLQYAQGTKSFGEVKKILSAEREGESETANDNGTTRENRA